MIKLRDYQENISSRAAELLRQHGCAYLAMQCRTGKTLTSLVSALKYGAKNVLFVTKLKAIPSVESDYQVLRNQTALYELVVVNYESVHKVKGLFDLVIVDEAHSLGAYPKPSQRTKTMKEVCGKLPVLYLSATPTPESLSQLYHQFWICQCSPWSKYKNFYTWAKDYVNVRPKKVNGYSINDYSDANKSKIDNDTRHLFLAYTQQEAGFDVPIEEHVLTVPMQPHTERYLATIRRKKVLELNGEVILADTPAKLLTKMHQLSSGTVISENGKRFVTDASKAVFVRSYFFGMKIAIFYVYEAERELLVNMFPNWTDDVEEFQGNDDKVFICQIRRAREGVRLDSADAIVFFALEFSYLSYEQGRNRLVSKERTEPAKVYFICSDCGIEKDILKAVHGKNDFTLGWYEKNRNRK